MISFVLLIPNFEKFVVESKSGKRLRKDGLRISTGTLRNYDNVLQLFRQFELHINDEIRIPILNGNSIKEFKKVKKHWQRIYEALLKYLHDVRKVYDNYAGLIIKTLKTFLNWLTDVKGLSIGKFGRSLFVRKENIPIITFSLIQMRKLIFDEEFIQSLPERLKKSREILVMGCLTGLRFSDLLRVNRSDFVQRDGNFYLQNISKKTKTSVLIKLPHEAMDLVHQRKTNGKFLFQKVSLVNFNMNIKEISELAGWTDLVKIYRSKRGKLVESTANVKKSGEYKFCELVSSHIMRRTAITNLLTLGVSELTVRKISGHSPASSSFMRYVNLAQSYLDNEMDAAHRKLQEIPAFDLPKLTENA